MQLIAGLVIMVLVFFLPIQSFAQNQKDFQAVSSERSERLVLPYTVVNRNEGDPFLYTFDEPRGPEWVVSLQNNLSYVPREGSRTIIKIHEPAPSEKYIELAIYGDQSKRYWVAANTPEVGYAILYDSDNGWSTDEPITLVHTGNEGLTVTNGKRTVVDRIILNGFTAASIEVYGSEGNSNLLNAYAGDITFQVLYPRWEESPLYYLGPGVMAGVGGLTISLLILKKRKPSD